MNLRNRFILALGRLFSVVGLISRRDYVNLEINLELFELAKEQGLRVVEIPVGHRKEK